MTSPLSPAACSSPPAVEPEGVPSPTRTSLEAIRERFDAAVSEHRTSGVTWAIIGGHRHGMSILADGAAGARHLVHGSPAPDSAPMDRATISRIASMTKSFTSATILALRDEGRLHLDDPISLHLPEAAGLFPPEQDPLLSDAPALTIRHLLTMSAGFVTDNPWGDRQEAMTPTEFAATLADGLGFVHAPGTDFEYSNTGYALLGRIIDEVEARPYQQVIRERFLDPLGLGDTAFDRSDLPADRIATGHRLADREDASRFEAEPFDSPGVYGAMAGLYSSVEDVAVWVRFLASADAPVELRDRRSASDIPHATILSAASRREMAQLHRLQHTPVLPAGAEGASPGFDRIRGYGMGLVIERFPDLGEVVSHSGGYPGYGSFMVWHRRSGIGLVALANSKYAPAMALCMEALRILRRESPELFDMPTASADPRTLEAARAALDWLSSGGEDADDAPADLWFASSMDQDHPRAERRRRRDTALAAAGLVLDDLRRLDVTDAEVVTRANLRWNIPAGTGAADGVHRLVVDLLMDPRRSGRIQALTVSARPR